MKKFFKNDKGQTLIEYAFIIFLLISLIVVAIPSFRNSTVEAFTSITNAFNLNSENEYANLPPIDEDTDIGGDVEDGLNDEDQDNEIEDNENELNEDNESNDDENNPDETENGGGGGEYNEGDEEDTTPWSPPELDPSDDNVIYSAQNISLSSGARIYGNVVTNGDVVLGWGSFIDGQIYDNAEYDFNFPLPEYPLITNDSLSNRGSFTAGWGSSMPTSPITEDGYYTSLKVLSNLTFNTGNEGDILTIVVDNFEVSGSGKINVTGNGKLVLKVNNNFTFTNSASLNSEGVPENVVMYYSGSNTLNLGGGNQQFVGSIYTETAGLSFNGGSSRIEGNIIIGGEQVTLSGGSFPRLDEAILYAPNANLNLSGGSSIKGRIIANSITASGNSMIIFEPVLLDSIFSWNL